jgi:hypothetical protein
MAYIPENVKNYINDHQLRDEYLRIEREGQAADVYYIDHAGSVVLLSKYDDATMARLEITEAEIAPAGKIPTLQEVSDYIESLDPDPIDGIKFENVGMIVWSAPTDIAAATEDEPERIVMARFMKIFDKYELVYSNDDALYPSTVNDINELKMIKQPYDGLTVQVLSHLPEVVFYTFNSESESAITPVDETTGSWLSGQKLDEIKFVNHIAGDDTAEASATSEADGFEAANVLDSDVKTAWRSDGEQAPELIIKVEQPFVANGYGLRRSSLSGDDVKGAGDVNGWTLYGSRDGSTWDEIEKRTGGIPKDVGFTDFMIDDATLEYSNYKFVFDLPSDADHVTLTEVALYTIGGTSTGITTISYDELS